MSGNNVPDMSFISSSGVTNQVLQMIGACQQEQGFTLGSPVEHFHPGMNLNSMPGTAIQVLQMISGIASHFQQSAPGIANQVLQMIGGIASNFQRSAQQQAAGLVSNSLPSNVNGKSFF